MLRCRAADGQPVNIPALPLRFIRVTKMGRRRALLDLLVGTPHWELEIRSTKSETNSNFQMTKCSKRISHPLLTPPPPFGRGRK